ncbi:MAG: rhodanese-like domain-containing protein [Saprospiraceae bacterium]|nr:rhodanese-like domain-containing protein [Saprospiraceae bacterium]
MIDITTEELKQKLDNKEDFVFIDVREPHEYEQFNLGAQLIPLGTLPHQLDQLEEHKEKEIIIHCRSGARSGNAKNYLAQLGYKNVRNLLGGVLRWIDLYGRD